MEQVVAQAWQICPGVYRVSQKAHVEYKMEGTGHGFDHSEKAAQIVVYTVDDPVVRRLAVAAAFLHSADRMLQEQRKVGRKEIPAGDVEQLVRGWLAESGDGFTEAETARIVNAILRHSGKNGPDDDEVLVALMDADRITCSTLDTVMEAAQHWRDFPVLSAEHLSHDPSANPYKNPKTVLKNLECRFDWNNPASDVCVRLPKAKALMEQFAADIKEYIEKLEGQRAKIGLWPYHPPAAQS
ncbi:MAG: hypothetical protein Q8P49_01270 [Candidatus Liptonbacteria bacterium]|nr:hypothetical protein [Candidatus Liptonbacteria bacterium]